MTTSTNKSLSTPFFALIFAALLLIAGCTNTITGPDATSQDQEEEVVARPFTGEQAPHEGEGSGSGSGPIEGDAAPDGD